MCEKIFRVERSSAIIPPQQLTPSVLVFQHVSHRSTYISLREPSLQQVENRENTQNFMPLKLPRTHSNCTILGCRIFCLLFHSVFFPTSTVFQHKFMHKKRHKECKYFLGQKAHKKNSFTV